MTPPAAPLAVESTDPGDDPSTGAASATKKRLLDAAERLFAERGFEGASMRAITREAGTSVSAANYHFGTKEALLHATLSRALEPSNRRSSELLDEVEEAAGGERLQLEAILDAYLRPVVENHLQSGDDNGRQVAARMYSDPPEMIQQLKLDLFGPLSARFTDAIARALPDNDPDALGLGFQFTVAIMVHVIAGQLDSSTWNSTHPDSIKYDRLLGQMIEFVAAGLRATPRRESPSE